MKFIIDLKILIRIIKKEKISSQIRIGIAVLVKKNLAPFQL